MDFNKNQKKIFTQKNSIIKSPNGYSKLTYLNTNINSNNYVKLNQNVVNYVKKNISFESNNRQKLNLNRGESHLQINRKKSISKGIPSPLKEIKTNKDKSNLLLRKNSYNANKCMKLIKNNSDVKNQNNKAKIGNIFHNFIPATEKHSSNQKTGKINKIEYHKCFEKKQLTSKSSISTTPKSNSINKINYYDNRIINLCPDKKSKNNISINSFIINPSHYISKYSLYKPQRKIEYLIDMNSKTRAKTENKAYTEGEIKLKMTTLY